MGVLIAGRSVVVEHAPRQAGKHLDNRLIRQFVILSLFIHYALYCTHVVEDIWLLCRRGTGPLESQPKELSVQEGVRVKDHQAEHDQVQKLQGNLTCTGSDKARTFSTSSAAFVSGKQQGMSPCT